MAYNKKEVLQANTDAIRVVLRLEKERREATEAEKSILQNYQGFGGLKCVLNRTDNPDDIRLQEQVQQLWKAVLILIVVERTLMMTTVMELSLR